MGVNRHQVLTLGRGVRANGQPTEATRERAVGSYEYYVQRGPEQVVFSGGRTLLAGPNQTIASEAAVMAEIAVDLGLPAEIIRLEENSRMLLDNFINSAPLLAADLPAGVVAHQDQMPRALFLADRIFAHESFDILVGQAPSRRDILAERVLLQASRLILAGVTNGNIDGFIKRRAQIDKLVQQRFVQTILRQMLSKDYRV